MNLGRNSLTLVLGVAFAAALFAGCGDDAAKNEPKDGGAQGVAVKKIADIDLSQAKDGTYNGESSENSEYGHGKIAITIKDHKIESATYFGIDKDGSIQKEIAREMKLHNAGQLPVFIIADTFNRIVFLSQGYTIGLGEQLVKTSSRL